MTKIKSITETKMIETESEWLSSDISEESREKILLKAAQKSVIASGEILLNTMNKANDELEAFLNSLPVCACGVRIGQAESGKRQ